MDDILTDERFDFISPENKCFINAFNAEMARLGYDFGGNIGSGYCWGKYMLIYTKTGVKSKNVYARIYIQDASLVLRLFFSNIDKHREYIEKAPAHIKDVFVGKFGDCRHDRDDAAGNCMFRKSYTLDGRLIEKCNGDTFWFFNPSVDRLKDYIDLFSAFYPPKKARSAVTA